VSEAVKLTDEEINKELETLLRRWDEGEIIHTVEMGGLGPGYEQCIHITVFEMLRDLLNDKPSRADEDFIWEKLDPTIEKASARLDKLGLSGAQWGAAKSVASRFYKVGYTEASKTIPEDRKMMVSNHYPQVPKATA
jgi:hypothetical protein